MLAEEEKKIIKRNLHKSLSHISHILMSNCLDKKAANYECFIRCLYYNSKDCLKIIEKGEKNEGFAK